MSCTTFYDFINGTEIHLPTGLFAVAAPTEDGRHGVRPLLKPDATAEALMRDHARLLAQRSRR